MLVRGLRSITRVDGVVAVTISGSQPETINKVLALIELHAKNIDMIIKNSYNDFVFIFSEDMFSASSMLRDAQAIFGNVHARMLQSLSKIEVLGVQMNGNTGTCGKLCKALFEKNIDVHFISVCDIGSAFIISEANADEAVSVLRYGFPFEY